LNWNIQNPSLDRAINQINWIEENAFDIIILTEAKSSKAGLYIVDRLKSKGYIVNFPKIENNDYGVILAVKGMGEDVSKIDTEFLPNRVSSIVCNLFGKRILLIGVYSPIWATEKQKSFLESFARTIENATSIEEYGGIIILGDMNMLETNHTSNYPFLKEWEIFYGTLNKYKFIDAFRFFYPKKIEYSWFTNGRDGQINQRIDHCFISSNLSDHLRDCFYIHEVRLKKLSDHSAMCLEIKEQL
jgi:exodeoxyribonuclease-3